MANPKSATKVATPKAVAKPTKVATNDLYSKACRNSYEEKAKVPKPIIFELTDFTKGPKGQKQFPVSAFFEARDIIFDPETNQRREIRYCKNEPSIYIEDQAEYSKSEIIRFQNGVVVAMPNNPALISYLRLCNLNKDNKHRLNDRAAAFYEIKPTVSAKINIQDEITVLDAVSLALRAPLEKVMPIASNGSKFTTDITAVGSSDTDCYLVPKNHVSHVRHLLLTNSNASARTFTIKIYEKVPNTTTTIFSEHSLATKTAESVFTMDKPIILKSEDKIVIAASAASSIVCVVSAEEFFDPNV